MNYLTSEAKDNTDDNRYFIMKYEEGLWYPGEEISYDNAVNQCSNPCYQVDSTGIRHVLKRNVSHGSKHKTRKKRRKKSKMYFGTPVQDAIIRYNESSNPVIKNRIYQEHIHVSLSINPAALGKLSKLKLVF